MEAAFIDRLTAQSTLAELPAYDKLMDLSTVVRVLDRTFSEDPQLPGVVVTDGGAVRGAISRGQYLRAVNRHLGREIYFPRPIRLMFEDADGIDRPMILPQGTTVPEAVRRALERPRQMIYEPVIVDADSGTPSNLRLIDFQDLLMADSRISTLRNRQMNEILSTVQEGFLLVGRDHRVASEYSRSVEAIFGHQQIAGRRLPALLTDLLDPERAELGRDYLETLFNPNVIERLVTQINPLRQVAAPREDGLVRHLAFRFQRSVEGGVIRHVLVRVEDTTREIELAAEVEAQEQKAQDRVDLALSLAGADPEQLAAFLDRLDHEIGAGQRLEDKSAEMSDVIGLFRRLHGLKGEAGMLQLASYQETIHALEGTLADLQGRTDSGSIKLSSLTPGFRQLEELVTETRSVIRQFRRLGQLSSEQTTSEAQPPTTKAGQPPSTTTPPSEPQNSPSQPSALLFQPIARMVGGLGERLGKPARFYTRVAEQEIPEKYHPLLRETLAQLARNAVIHGLEPPSERQRRGKPAVGTLQVALREYVEHQRWELIFQDDGAGLDLDKIRRRAQELGLREVSEDQLPHLIFRSGFSTASETTLDAGRGVGMDMVRSRIEDHGGLILPHFQPGVFCAFQILLPY